MASDALGRFKHNISSQCCSSPSKQENMNNNNNNIDTWEGFCKLLKIKKTIAYTYNNVSMS